MEGTARTDRDLHAALGTATVALYITTAYFAIRRAQGAGHHVAGPIRLHKTLAWIHGPGMILTPILGEMAFAKRAAAKGSTGSPRRTGRWPSRPQRRLGSQSYPYRLNSEERL